MPNIVKYYMCIVLAFVIHIWFEKIKQVAERINNMFMPYYSICLAGNLSYIRRL